jgi:hypothetical protein
MRHNFNLSNYPPDHEWIDIDDYKYHEETFKLVFKIAYSIKCHKCGLHIKHQVLNRDYEDYEEIKYHEEDEFYTYDNNLWIINFEYDIDNINYKEINSCSEMIIKSLLE